MPDYQKSKIYKICCDDSDIVYYGATTKRLCTRMAQHKHNFKKRPHVNSKLCFEKGNAYIELVENFPCNSIDELNTRERYYIKNFKCVNKMHPGRSRKEYCEENPEKIKEYSKKYYEENKEDINERKKKYYEENPEKEKERVKKYYEENLEKEKERKKKYYEKNQEKIKEKKKEKIKCEKCNCLISRDGFREHLKTIKHNR